MHAQATRPVPTITPEDALGAIALVLERVSDPELALPLVAGVLAQLPERA